MTQLELPHNKPTGQNDTHSVFLRDLLAWRSTKLMTACPRNLSSPTRALCMAMNVERASLRVPVIVRRQIEGRLLFPLRRDAFLRYRGGKLVLAHLHDGISVVRAMFALYSQVSRFEHRYLDASGIPLLVTQRHSQLNQPGRRVRSFLLARSCPLDVCRAPLWLLSVNCSGDIIGPTPHAWRTRCTQRSGDAGITSFLR